MTVTDSEKDLDCMESDTDNGDIMPSGYHQVLWDYCHFNYW